MAAHHRASTILPHHRFPRSLGAPLIRVTGRIERVFESPAHHHGANHQHFTVRITEIESLRGSDENPEDLNGIVVFVAVRFGDFEGLDSEITGLAVGNAIQLQGEYIRAADAYPTEDNDDPILPVIHFTHHPVGFIKYNNEFYS